MGNRLRLMNKNKIFDVCNWSIEWILFFYLFNITLTITTFHFPYLKVFQYALFLAMTIVVGIKMLLLWPWHRNAWFGAVLAMVYLLVFYSDRYGFLLFLGITTLGCIDIDFDRLIKIYLLSVGMVTIVAIISSLGGAITNLVYLKDNYVRSSWGIYYPTDLASLVLFLLMFLYVIWKKLPAWCALCLAVLSLYISWYVAHSQTSTYCSVLFFIAICFNSIDQRFLSGHKCLKWISDTVHFLYVIMFPVSAVGMMTLTYALQKNYGFAYRINELLSNRVQLASDAVTQHGLHPFGVPFEMIGAGSSVYSALNYNFIDSTYMLILVRYGWVLLICICVLWCWMTQKAIKCGNYRLAAVMAIIAFHSISEHHFMEVHYNILLIMPFAHMHVYKAKAAEITGAQTEDKVCSNAASAGIQQMLPKFAALLPLTVMGLVFRTALDWMRTLVQAVHLTGDGKREAVVFAFVLMMLMTLAALMWCCYHAALKKCANNEAGAVKDLDLKLKGIPVIVVSVVLIYTITIAAANYVIHQAELQQQDLLAEDAESIEAILKAKTGNLYVTDFPEVYHRRFPGIHRSVFSGEELAHGQNTTVVMARDFDSKVFSKTGFLYTPISDKHAIYTNDRGVITALQNEGYHFTGYCPAVYPVDLAEQARLNQLPETAAGSIMLDGAQHSMLHGPYVNLYEGMYTVTYDIAISDPDQAYTDDYEVALLRVTAYNGEIQCAEVPVSRSQFDANGHYTATIDFWSGGYQDIEFLAIADSGRTLRINSISYTRKVDLDTHIFLNKYRQKVREEYYDLDGNKTMTSDGYAACEYEYDHNGNINVIRYYDKDNQLVMNTSGYAEIHRTFNERHQVIRDEYFGTDHKPIRNLDGISAIDRQYDDNGNVIDEKYYDTDGQPVNNINGFAHIVRKYDANHQVISETHYDAAGQIVA